METKTFGTSDALKAVCVGRSRFRTWVDNKYITPFNSASGYGTKAEWTKENLYRANLFFHLISIGIHRKRSSELASAFLREKLLSEDLLVLAHRDGAVNITEVEAGSSIPKLAGDLIVVDIENIRAEVDGRLDN